MKQTDLTPSEQTVPMEDYQALKHTCVQLKQQNRWQAMKLNAVSTQNEVLRSKLKTIAGQVRRLGETPLLDVNQLSVEEKNSYYSLQDVAELCETYCQRICKCLKEDGILTSYERTWVVEKGYQTQGYFTYFYGVNNNYTRFYLKVTHKGLCFIKRQMSMYDIHQKRKKNPNPA